MGINLCHLNKPITEKVSCDDDNHTLRACASSMQGWRVSQEDAHNCILDFDTNTSLFAVFDGHRGHEVAEYCKRKLPDFIKNTDAYKNNDLENALIDAFLGIDATIATTEVITELEKIAGEKQRTRDVYDDDSDEETQGRRRTKKMSNSSSSEDRDCTVKGQVEDPKVKTDAACDVAKSNNSVDSNLSNNEEKVDVPLQTGKTSSTIETAPTTETISSKDEKTINLDAHQANGEICKKRKASDGVEDKAEEKGDEGKRLCRPLSSDSGDKKKLKRPGYHNGTTAIVALLRENQLVVANVGGSRCIVCRNGKAVNMSHKHTPFLKEESERICKAGGRARGGRINRDHNMSRAIGDHKFKQNKELSDREQMITALPDVRTLTINPAEDEFMVLVCDGMMSNEEIVAFVKSKMEATPKKLSEICEQMFDLCLGEEGFRRGDDNMTAVIVQFKSNVNKKASSNHEESENPKQVNKTDQSETTS